MSGVFGDNGITIAVKHIQALLEAFIISFFISEIIKEYDIDILKCIVFIGFIASIITLYLLLNPMKSVYLRTNVITDSLVDMGYDAELHMFRSFGIAEGLTSIYGVVQGFIAALCLINIRKSYFYLFPVPFLVLSAFVNARTGVLIFLVSIPFFFSYTIKQKRGLLVYFVLFVLILFLVIFFKNEEISKTIEWGLSMFNDISNFFSGKKTGNIAVLLDEMVFLPEKKLSFLFGTGNIAINENGHTSDISFINQIFLGGFFYMFVIMFFCLYLTFFSYRRTRSFSFATLVFFSLLFMNIKGMDPTLPNGLIRLIILFLFSYSPKKGVKTHGKKTPYIFRYIISR